ncbi:MAG: 6-carboxytetrahydropterin synthase QueD [Candidatus Margulisiibacteriota bacterium]
MFEITVEDYFAAAHFLRRYQGNCENMHGHNYRVQVFIQTGTLDEADLALDFKKAKLWLKQVLDGLDHKALNDLPPFTEANPSAENIARYVFNEYKKLLPSGTSLKKVSIWETERNGVSYWE